MSGEPGEEGAKRMDEEVQRKRKAVAKQQKDTCQRGQMPGNSSTGALHDKAES